MKKQCPECKSKRVQILSDGTMLCKRKSCLKVTVKEVFITDTEVSYLPLLLFDGGALHLAPINFEVTA